MVAVTQWAMIEKKKSEVNLLCLPCELIDLI